MKFPSPKLQNVRVVRVPAFIKIDAIRQSRWWNALSSTRGNFRACDTLRHTTQNKAGITDPGYSFRVDQPDLVAAITTTYVWVRERW
jgi:hypothetical protein